MGRGTYSGGGTVVRIGESGTHWDKIDAAENKKSQKKGGSKRKADSRNATQKEIERETERETAEEQRLIRSFISMCVSAYSSNKLTATAPRPPRILHKRIANAGGNIKWLENNKNHQIYFHKAYCRLRQEDVPFERVWSQPSPRK